MQPEQSRAASARPADAPLLLSGCNLHDPERGRLNVARLAEAVGADGWQALAGPLARHLPRCADPDRALNSLERFLTTPAGGARLPALLEARGRLLATLVQLFAASQLFGDLLGQHPEDLDVVRAPTPAPGREELCAALRAVVATAGEDSAILRAFRRFRQRQVLRVGVNDVVRDRPLEEVTRDLSRVADAALEVALEVAQRTVAARFGRPVDAAGRPVTCVALAFGKLGGEELNYSSDIDLMFVYSAEGAGRGPSGAAGADEYFARVVGEVVRLLAAHTERGLAYRVDLRLRPEGARGPLARSLESTLAYYDALGRTWERQALIKVRPAAGDRELGARFLQAVEPFVYRKYLSFAEINEIKALKRRAERQAAQARGDADVKSGPGGIRDIEFAVQFLQLLNGGDLPRLRQRNTLAALQELERAGCLTDPEYRVLDDAYRFLRKTEHRLQLLCDLQTHRLPDDPAERRRLALRMGYAGAAAAAALDAAHREKTGRARRILNHLFHQAFAGEPEEAAPESDLLLDPHPDPETVRTVLGRYPFRDVPGAYHHLNQLAQESVPFLSARRCRHFLASIAPDLLRAVAETPDPDMALVNLEKVTASLGAKAVLWELFSFNRPSLRLYVDLCAWSQFLSEILVHNPGMIDELLDSLVLNQPRSLAQLRAELADLCRGAADLGPILRSFQDKEFLRIGVRDILGKAAIRETTAGLSDLAEAVLVQVAVPEYGPLVARHGVPVLADGPRAGRPCRYAWLALGKLGARAMSYHSDLDLVLVYEGDGRTEPTAGGAAPIDNQQFFTELAQRVLRAVSQLGPMGRLYAVDMRLRPAGRSGSLVTPLAEFGRYYAAGGAAQVWERMALTRARVILDHDGFGDAVRAVIHAAVFGQPWRAEHLGEIRAMRRRLEASRDERDLKRAPGGLVDVEFLVQTLQLKHGGALAALQTPDTWEGLDALHAAGLLSAGEQAALRCGYDFLLRVQSRLRIAHNRSLDEVPAAPDEVEKLARRLGFAGGPPLLEELRRQKGQLRALLERVFNREAS